MTRTLIPVLGFALALMACGPEAEGPETTAGPGMRVDLSEPPPPVSTGEEPVEQQSPVEGGGVMIDLGDRGIRHADDTPVSAPTSAPESQPISSVESDGRGYNAGLRAPGSLSGKPDGPEAATASHQMPVGASRSVQGLAETASPVAGGGVMIDLQGRFMSYATAAQDAEGNVAITCGQRTHLAAEPCPHCSQGEDR